MKKSMVILCAMMLVLGVVGISSATLEVIGTANYLGGAYNLIYENDQGLIWLDYSYGATIELRKNNGTLFFHML